MLENIYLSGYIDHNQTYKMSFIKGVAAGFGGVIGATVVVALVIWILSLVSDLPVIQHFNVDRLKETIETQQQ